MIVDKNIVMVLALIGILSIAGCTAQETPPELIEPPVADLTTEQENTTITDSENRTEEDLPPVPVINDTTTKTFVLTGEPFKFVMDGVENPELRVQEGDIVRIEFTSTSGFHDWVVDEFSARTERVNRGGSSIVEFVAGKKGTFAYYCSVQNHRAAGMEGMFVVE